MRTLGDHFPLEDRQEHIRSELNPGKILYLDAAFTDPPKPKYVVLACVQPKPVLLLINSRVNPNVERDPSRAGRHLRLSASDYAFLSHDSFLDCSKEYGLASDLEMTGQLVADLGRIKGDLTQADKLRVVEIIKTSPTIPPRIIKAIEMALGSPTNDQSAATQ